jgi:hypothetical protein
MLLTAAEEQCVEGELWSSSERYRLAFGHDSTMARLFMRVARALERGEMVGRSGGWVREGDGVFKRESQREDG